MSDTHRAFGRGALNCRLTRSSGHGAAALLIVVRTVLPRTTPCRPILRIRRATVQRATAIPSRRFAVLALKRLDALALGRRRTGPQALVTLSLPHPVAQCLARAADLLGNRVDRRPLRGVLCLVVQDHPNRAGTNLRGIRGNS